MASSDQLISAVARIFRIPFFENLYKIRSNHYPYPREKNTRLDNKDFELIKEKDIPDLH